MPIVPLMLALTLAAVPQTARAPAPEKPVLTGTPPPPAPKLDVEPFRFLIGRWRGKGVFGFSGGPLASTMTFELASRTTIVLRGDEDAPNTYEYVATWSREKDSNDLLMLMSSSLDGPALLHSTGWVGDRLVFEPKAGVNTGPSSVRFTYVKKSATEFELAYEFSVGGKWLLGDRQVFTKVE